MVSLDSKKFKLVQQLDAAMTSGTPSLIGCDRLTVEGDVRLAGSTVFKVGGYTLQQTDFVLCREEEDS